MWYILFIAFTYMTLEDTWGMMDNTCTVTCKQLIVDLPVPGATCKQWIVDFQVMGVSCKQGIVDGHVPCLTVIVDVIGYFSQPGVTCK